MTFIHTLSRIGCLFILLSLGGCTLSSAQPTNSPPTQTTPQTSLTLADLRKRPRLVVLASGSELLLHSPDLSASLPIYTFKAEEKPAVTSLDTFYLSPNHQWVLWYSPTLGVIALNIVEAQTQVLYPPSDFLNTNPFVGFSPDKNLVLFITNTGNTLQMVNLDSLDSQAIDIPYPYGNLFSVSPDENSILFISGYGQSKQKPKFMFTDMKGKFSRQFTSDTNIADRHWVIWTPDSTGVVMIEENRLQYYALVNPDEPETLFTLPTDGNIVEIYGIGDRIFALSDHNFWHVFSYALQKEVARTPTVIAHELQNPKLLPWSETEFLMEETFKDGNRQFNRLWLSNFRGTKHIALEKYQEITVQTEVERLD